MKTSVFFIGLYCLIFLPIKSQNITFSDGQLKTILLSVSTSNELAKDLNGNWCVVDTNGDGEIQVSEASNLSYLTISDGYFHSFGELNYFENLETLNFNNNRYIDTLDVSALTQLKVLNCNAYSSTYTALQSLIGVSGNTNLEELNLNKNLFLTSLNLSGCTSLKSINATHSGIQTLNLSNCSDLETINFYFGKLNSIDISDSPILEFLNLRANHNIPSLDLSNNNDLLFLDIGGTSISSLDLSNLTALKILNTSGNPQLTSFDISNNLALEELYTGNNFTPSDLSMLSSLKILSCEMNNLTALDLSQNTDLEVLVCSGNNLTTLDLSGLNELEYLECSNNNLEYLNIVGTQLNNFNPNYYVDNNFMEVCCDILIYNTMYHFLQNNGYPNCIVNVGTNCSPVNQSIVSVTFDNDSDGCDPNDDVLESFKVNVHSSIQDTDFEFNENSNYTIYAAGNVATITPILINSSYFTITPPSYSVDYSQGNFQTLEFCVAPNGNHNDLEITLVPENFAVPGFNAKYKLIYKNRGTTTLSGNVQLTFQDDYMDLVSATPSVDTQSTNSLTWNYTNLAPFESREIFFTMNMNTPTDADYPLNGGDILSFQALVNPIETDETPIDNIATLRQEVVNSYDPNDKILLEGSQILPEMVGEYVHYRIRFENTGTANAINVFVEDTIDPTQFDISTLEVVDASHSVRTVIEDDLIKFQFYNINLPFDDANNDGYVVFKIKILDTLALNDTFSNQAEIYFDYNAPIVTNNFTTTIVENLGTEDVESPSDLFTLSPNPARDFFTIQTSEAIQKVELFDASGRLVKSFVGNASSYNISQLSEGVYVVKVYTATQTQNVSFIKK